MKHYKERNYSFYKLHFGNALSQCQNAFEKNTAKAELCNEKSYIIRLCTRL